MRIAWLIFLLFATGSVLAQSAKPPPQVAADEALAALASGDEAALHEIVNGDGADPWLVADELCRRGEFDAAAGLARAGKRAETDKLEEWVDRRRGSPDDAAARALLARLNRALQSGRAGELLGMLVGVRDDFDSVVGLRIAHSRAYGLYVAKRRNERNLQLRSVAEGAEKIGWLSRAAKAWRDAGQMARDEDDTAAIAVALAEFARIEEVRQSAPAGIAEARFLAGDALLRLGELDRARANAESSRAGYFALGDQLRAAAAGAVLADVLSMDGDRGGSIKAGQEAVAGLMRVVEGEDRLRGQVWLRLGEMFGRQHADRDAAACLTEAGSILPGSPVAFEARLEMVTLVARAGEYTKARRMLEELLPVAVRHGWAAYRARIQCNLGALMLQAGDTPGALHLLDDAFRTSREAGEAEGAAGIALNLAFLHLNLGDSSAALRFALEARPVLERLEHRFGLLSAQRVIMMAQARLGDPTKTIAEAEALRRLADTLRRQEMADIADHAIAEAIRVRGETDEAARRFEELESRLRKRDRPGILHLVLASRADLVASRGELEEARALCEEAIRLADRYVAEPAAKEVIVCGEGDDALVIRGTLAAILSEMGEQEIALGLVHEIWTALGGEALGHGDRALVRAGEHDWPLLELGLLAAARLEDPGELFWFAETARGRALQVAFQVDRRLTEGLIGEELVQAEREARFSEAAARRALDLGVKRQAERALVAELEDRLDEAVFRRQEVLARIQRKVRAGVGLAEPTVAPILEIQDALGEDEAFIEYVSFAGRTVALLCARDGGKVVELDSVAHIEDACKALAVEDPRSDSQISLARLKNLIVEPLGLDRSVHRVYVSPEGGLCHLPLRLLFPEREAVFVPSGTIWLQLRGDAKHRGSGTLAVGDPDIDESASSAGTSTDRLPHSRAEAALVGSDLLLGGAATEEAFTSVLRKQERWRSVHLACHGIVDEEQPLRSSLRLSPSETNDGLLTLIDIHRLSVPADLVVLSACETGRGRYCLGEGSLGLVRGFFGAGSARVLSSLWDVEDEATKELMVRFYDLWDPEEGEGLPAATALRRAQDYIRTHPDHPEWKHPAYWAAWVLWGLP